MQFFKKFTLWESPCSCPTPWCLWGWTSPRWSWLSLKHLEVAIIIILNNLEQPLLMPFFQKFTLWGESLVLPYTLVSLGLDFTQMVLAVRNNLEMDIIIILNNSEQPLFMQIFQKKVLLGEVLALALHLGVFGAGRHPDGAGCLKHLKVAIIIILNNPH